MTTPGAETDIYTLTRRWIESGWQKGQSEVVDELHAPNFVDNNPAGRGSDNDGFKEGIVQLYAAFPDFHARIEDILIDAAQGKAAVRWIATGTHRGTFMGCDPSGRVILACIDPGVSSPMHRIRPDAFLPATLRMMKALSVGSE